MKISYAIPVKDEFIEIQRLLTFLLENKDKEDEIVVLWDSKNGDRQVETYLRKMNVEKSLFRWYPYEFDGHFANMKNYLTSLCEGDWIVQLDADEMIGELFIPWVKGSIEANSNVDAFFVPRINTVEGLTQEHIQKWGWNVNEKGWVNWPDQQSRIYKNSPEIRWEGTVHEKIVGVKTITAFPYEEVYALYHPKQIERQERQNEFYETI